MPQHPPRPGAGGSDGGEQDTSVRPDAWLRADREMTCWCAAVQKETSTASPDLATLPARHLDQPTLSAAAMGGSFAADLVQGLPILKGKLPDIVTAPGAPPSAFFRAFYPAGSINPSNQHAPRGGFSFYSAGIDPAALHTAREVTFTYSVYFDPGFAWQLGGKLPGVFGGTSDERGMQASGGRQDGRDECFSVRCMWREGGAGELYAYLPGSVRQSDQYYECPPRTVLNPQYGDSLGRGAFTFESGRWTTLSQRIRLNDIGGANGELELLVDGQSKMNIGGLTLRVKSDCVVRGMMIQTFFGGSSNQYASPKDQHSYFKDFSLTVTA